MRTQRTKPHRTHTPRTLPTRALPRSRVHPELKLGSLLPYAMMIAEKEWTAAGSTRVTGGALGEAIIYLMRKLCSDISATEYEHAAAPDGAATRLLWHARIKEKLVEAYRMMPITTTGHMLAPTDPRRRKDNFLDTFKQRRTDISGDAAGGAASAAAQQRRDEPCRDYTKNRCSRGAACKFSHHVSTKP